MAQGSAKARDVATWIVQTLRERGHVAYFAGGCVRDELLGLTPKDYDVATDARPDAIERFFPRTAHVGAAFGVMLVRHDGVTVEVATFRADGEYTDRRRPDQITFSDEMADAKRRDFTVNALFLDPAKDVSDSMRVIDHVGGVKDLHAKVLRAVGDADQRLREDDLRALRAVRLATRLGFAIETATQEAIRRHAGELSGISRERIGDEIRLMLAHESRGLAVRQLGSLGLDGPTFGRPAIASGRTLVGLRRPRNDDPCDPVAGALASALLDREGEALVGNDGAGEGRRLEVMRATRTALCLSNEERDDCLAVLRLIGMIRDGWLQLPVAKQKRSAASRGFGWALEVQRATDVPGAEAVEGRVAELAGLHGGLAPRPFVTGDDLVAAGLSPGPAFRTVLERTYDDQLEGRIGSPSEALERAIRTSRELGGGSGV
ncbi:MAG: CCA tRNA nucleotidyltransferase [Phycisphaerae bacterium]|nr:CCA tRNA nucleotidyltransferase [Phycisphaerae bacterium]